MLPGLVLLLAIAPAALPARPLGTAVRLTIGELVERADLCVEGRVTAARAFAGPGRRIDTEYTFAVERTFWGEPQASRAIRIPGGVLPDGSGMAIPGLPMLAEGEAAILFLSKADALGARMPIGLAQGRISVATDAKGRKRLVRDLSGLALVAEGGARAGAVRAQEELGYAEVVAAIESAVAARRKSSR